MVLRGSEQAEITHLVSSDTFSDAGSYGILTMSDLVSLYGDIHTSGLSPRDAKRVQGQHYNITESFVMSVLDTFAQRTSGSATEYDVAQATSRFNETIDGITKLSYPLDDLKKLSVKIIDYSLLKDGISQEVSDAAATLALAIGNDSQVIDAKIKHLSNIHAEAAKKAESRATDDIAKVRALHAQQMLSQLGVTVVNVEKPSIKDSTINYTKEHSKGITMKATVAAVALSIFMPNVANAGEPTSPIMPALQGALKNNEVAVAVPSSGNESNNTPQEISLATPTEAKATAPVEVQVSYGMANEKKSPSDKSNVDSEAKATPNATTPPAAPEAANSPTDTTPQTMSLTPDTTADKPSSNQEVTVAVPVEIAPPNTSDQSPSTPNTTVPINAPIVVSPETPASPPSPNQEQLTPDQKIAKEISDQLSSDGNIPFASSRIVSNFGANAPTVTNPTDQPPTAKSSNLLSNVKTIEASYKDLITASGHSDVNYINTSLMNLAVLDAAANDPTVLASPDLQKLITSVKRPDDPYQAKLFDQYLAQAKTILEANNSQLLVGIEKYKDQVETMYAYAIMADTTDVDQSGKIQVMKDSDAKAAAEKAAAEKAAADKAATDAAAKAQEQAGNSQSLEAEAMKNLIDDEQNPAKKRTYYVLNYLMVHGGLTVTQATGIVGNLLVESASTMDPSIKQFSGPARGIAQWEAGRLKSLQEYAASKGKPWDDLDTQLDFLLAELAGRQNTLQRIQETQTVFDAANQFMIHFETPFVVVHAQKTGDWTAANNQAKIRAGRGQPILDDFNAAVNSVTSSRAAAQVAAKAAETQAAAAAKANAEKDNHMSNGQDIINQLIASGAKNGELEPNRLIALSSPHIDVNKGIDNLNSDYYNNIRNGGNGEFMLNPEAAGQLQNLAEAYSAEFHTNLTLAAAYRPFASQEDQKKYWSHIGKPGHAATPGYSNHGWGLAIDISMASGSKGDAEHKWLVANAPKYGWDWPNAAGEKWHFEYVGSAARANNDDRPEPGLHQS